MLLRLLGLAALILTGGLTYANLHSHSGGATIGAPSISSAPELDPSAAGAGLTLLAGGLTLLAERRRTAGKYFDSV